MSHSFLDGHQIRAGFIKVKAERMAEAVEIKAGLIHPRLLQMADEGVANRLFADVRAGLLAGEKPVLLLRSGVRGADVGNEQAIRLFGKHSITVGTVLAAGDVNAVLRAADILAVKTA